MQRIARFDNFYFSKKKIKNILITLFFQIYNVHPYIKDPEIK